MTLHTFVQQRWIPSDRLTLFLFFSDARNLEAITPPWLKFKILTAGEIRMGEGALIDYRLRLHGVPLRWQTEITHWNPHHCFVDEQRRGPFRFWRHTHTLAERDGGTLCRDEIHYAVPGGRFVNWLFVRRDLEKIFAYRAEALGRRFAPAR